MNVYILKPKCAGSNYSTYVIYSIDEVTARNQTNLEYIRRAGPDAIDSKFIRDFYTNPKHSTCEVFNEDGWEIEIGQETVILHLKTEDPKEFSESTIYLPPNMPKDFKIPHTK